MSNELSGDKQDRLDRFLDRLETDLLKRYQSCPTDATADSILLAVLNAIAEARK